MPIGVSELTAPPLGIVVISQFAECVSNAPSSLQPILGELYCLYALSCIEADLSWFLTNELLSLDQGDPALLPDFLFPCPTLTRTCGTGRKVGDAVRGLCATLAPQALHLVDAFGIPDHMVQAPIALDWQKFNLDDNQGECVSYVKAELGI